MARSLFLTGVTGFVGRRLLARLDPERFDRVVCLVRRADPELHEQFQHSESEDSRRVTVEWVVGNLGQPGGYASALQSCSHVLHLAAATGKASAEEYQRANVEGTRVLVEASQKARVERFVFVSSIAVRFPDQSHYHYAHSKAEAERIVREVDPTATTIRPTIIVGSGAPVLEGLSKLAGLPIMPVFGSGDVHVQPIDVLDLCDALSELLIADEWRGKTLELGGPESLRIEDFLARLRFARFGQGPRALHLPLGPIRALLGAVEPVLLPVLPLTAGQLATFANDGVAEPSEFHESRRSRLRPLQSSLELGNAEPSWASSGAREFEESDEFLDQESSAFVRYLTGTEAKDAFQSKYREFCRQRPEASAASEVDRFLLQKARAGGFSLAMADVYSARWLPHSTLRVRLVGALGILECLPDPGEAMDAPDGRGPVSAGCSLVANAARELVTLMIATVCLAPSHWRLRRQAERIGG